MIPRVPVEDDDDDSGGGTTPLWRRPRVLMVAGFAAVVLAFVFSRGKEPAKHNEETRASDRFIAEIVGYQPPARLILPAKAQEKQAEPIQPPPPPPRIVEVQPAPQPPPAPPLPAPPRIMPPGLGQGQAPPPAHTRMLVYALPPPTPAARPEQNPETGLDFKVSTIAGLKASPAIDDTYQLMPGLLPLVLDTAINSDVPGPILAHLPGPVYSRKGVLLMEAGTQVIGSYASMGKGSRLKAVSTVAYTPNGVWVPLTSEGMSDDLGRSGLDGEVDRHIMQRFGPAILLSLAGQGLNIIQSEASKGGNTYLNFGNGGGGGGGGIESLASQILQSQINIPDTFNKHQGETIALFIDKPVDFSASYRVHKVKEGQ